MVQLKVDTGGAPHPDTDDERFMRACARARAAFAPGRAWPNPAVGAVIVKDGVDPRPRLDPTGRAAACGSEAPNPPGGRAPGATLYVTLEPCSHEGKTPPCADAIISSGRRARGLVDRGSATRRWPEQGH